MRELPNLGGSRALEYQRWMERPVSAPPPFRLGRVPFQKAQGVSPISQCVFLLQRGCPAGQGGSRGNGRVSWRGYSRCKGASHEIVSCMYGATTVTTEVLGRACCDDLCESCHHPLSRRHSVSCPIQMESKLQFDKPHHSDTKSLRR